MTPSALDGIWWRPERPDDQVAGHLTAGLDRIRLDLLGVLDGAPDEVPLIHGAVGGQLISLLDAARVGSTITVPGFSREEWQPQYAALGEHVDALVVEEMRLELEPLTDWARQPAIAFEKVGEPENEGIRMQYTPPATLRAEIAASRVALEWDWGTSADAAGDYTLSRRVRFVITPRSPIALDAIDDLLATLQTFVTLAAGVPASTTRMQMRPAAVTLGRDDSRPRRWMDLYRPLQLQRTGRRMRHDEAFFRLSDIEGRFAEVIANWARARERLRATCDLYFGNLYDPAAYSESRFLGFAQSAEVLHRDRFGGPHRLALVRRIRDLSERAPEVVRDALGDLDIFADAVRETRNYYTHWSGDRSRAAQGVALVVMTQRLRLLVQSHLMSELGFTTAQLDALLRPNRLVHSIAHLVSQM